MPANKASSSGSSADASADERREPTGTLSIAVLKCDKLHKDSRPKHGTYEDVLHNLFEPIVADVAPHLTLKTQAYDVVTAREYPSEKELASVDAVLITGSFEDDSVADETWILRLCGFLIQLNDSFPRIRIVGICFGLQVLVRAFGPSRVEKNKKGWEVGSTRVELTEMGRTLVWGTTGDEDPKDLPDSMSTMQIHSDICTSLPSDFTLLASSELSPIQGIAHFYDDDKRPPAFVHSDEPLPPDPWRRVHMIAFQGHPEWVDSVVVPFINDYEKDGTFTPEFAEAARERARKKHDGVELGRALLKVLGVAKPIK